MKVTAQHQLEVCFSNPKCFFAAGIWFGKVFLSEDLLLMEDSVHTETTAVNC